MFRPFRNGLLALFLTLMAVSAVRADPLAFVIDCKSRIEARLGPDVVAALHDIDDGSRKAAELEAIAHGLALRRNFELAAWLYAASIERDPSAAASWSSLGVLIDEGVLSSPPNPNDERIRAGMVGMQREARRLDSRSAAIANNLGSALAGLGALRNDRSMIEEGAYLILEATQGNPRSSIYYVRLAESLKQIGETSAAQKFLESAFQLNSAHPSLVMSRATGGGLSDLPFSLSAPQNCQVNFDCERNCPKSIIGQIDLVTCKMEEASAQSNCLDGRVFARFFDCSAKLPRFGILLPGLDAGFSIVTPWGSIDAVMQGDGSVDFQMKFLSPSLGPAQAAVTTQGKWEPHRGALALTFGTQAQVNLFNRLSPVMNQANAYDVGISVVERYQQGSGGAVALEIGRGAVLTN